MPLPPSKNAWHRLPEPPIVSCHTLLWCHSELWSCLLFSVLLACPKTPCSLGPALLLRSMLPALSYATCTVMPFWPWSCLADAAGVTCPILPPWPCLNWHASTMNGCFSDDYFFRSSTVGEHNGYTESSLVYFKWRWSTKIILLLGAGFSLCVIAISECST